MKDKECKEALEYANDLVRSTPDDGIGWILKGNCHYRMGEIDEAHVAYGRAADLGDVSSHANFLQGSCLIELGRIEEAIAPLRKQLEVTPDHLDALFLLALILRILEDRDESDALLERIRDIDTEFYEEMLANYTELLAKGATDPMMQMALQDAARVLRGRDR